MEKLTFRNCIGCEAKVRFLWAIFNELKEGDVDRIRKKLREIMEEALKGNILDTSQFQTFKNAAKDLIPISMEERNSEKKVLIQNFRNELIEALAAD